MSDVLTPMALLHLAVLLAIVRLWRKQKECRRRLRWVAVPFLLLTLLNSPPAAYLALGSLEWPYPPSDEVPRDAGAIVVLAGSVRPPDRVRTRPELGPSTLYRCLHAAALHRAAPDLPVLVSGGELDEGGLSSAGVMRSASLKVSKSIGREVVNTSRWSSLTSRWPSLRFRPTEVGCDCR